MQTRDKMVFFGEAERGEYYVGHHCHHLDQLLELLGEPPPESRGIYYAIQALLNSYELFYFRVKEEGYSHQDYFNALKVLQLNSQEWGPFAAICAPGVGDSAIFNAMRPVCYRQKCLLITTEPDLYDYLMQEG